MRTPRLATSLLLATSLTACLPDRDNPNDSANRPTAQLRVIDRAGADGICVPAGAVPPGEGAIAAASRGRCIGLDARASEDPQGDALEYRFFWTTGGAASIEHPVTAAAGDIAGVASLDVDWVRQNLPARRVVSFGVEVDADGGSSVALAGFMALNEAPVAHVPPPVILARGGLPWAPGEDYTVRFRPAATDGDGDPPSTYCWTFDGIGPTETACSSDPEAAGFERTIPSSSLGRLVATLTVDDGDLTSTPISTWALVAPAPVTARDDVAGFHVLDPLTPLVVPAFGSGNVVGFSAGDEATFVTVAQDSPFRFQLRDTGSGGVLDEVDVTGNLLSPQAAYDAARNRVWAVGLAPVTGSGLARTYALEDAQFGAATSDVPLGFVMNNPPTVAAVEDGSVFVVAPALGATGVVRLRPLDTPPYIAVDPIDVECCFNGSAGLAVPRARPGHPEVWIARTLQDGNPALTRLAVAADDTVAVTEFDVGGAPISAIAWASSSGLWAVADNHGAMLLDAGALANGASFDDAVLLHHPEVTTATWLVCDPYTSRDCHAGGASETWQLAGDSLFSTPGARAAANGFSAFQARFVDRLGAFWNLGPQRILATTPDRVLFEFHRFADAEVHDPFTGGAWITADGRLQRIAVDGTLLREVTEVEVDGIVQPAPALGTLAREPGGALWGLADDGVMHRIADPLAEVPVATTVPLLGDPSEMPFFQPVRIGGTPKAWYGETDEPESVRLVDATTQSMTVPFTVPETSVSRHAEASPVSGFLCLVTAGNMGSPHPVVVRLVNPDGGADELGSDDTDPVVAVAHSRDTTGTYDLCWVATSSAADVDALGCPTGKESRIRAWRDDRTLVVDECVDGEVLSLEPFHEDEMVFSSHEPPTYSTVHAVRDTSFHYFVDIAPDDLPVRFLP